MDRGNVLSGAAFSAVLLSAVAFLVVLATVGVMGHSYVTRNLTDALHQEVQTRWDLFAEVYGTDGTEELVGLIDSAILFTDQGRRAVGLFDEHGKPIAGNLLTPPKATGWQEGALDLSPRMGGAQTTRTPVDFLYHVDRIGDLMFVVGETLDHRVQIDRAILRTLAITGFVIVLVMLGSGYFFSRTSLRKLEQMETVLAQVAEGDMGARLVVSPSKDQIDRIALRLNTHLDALSRLMVSTRATTAAIAHDLRSPLARAYLGLGRALDRVDAGADPRVEIEDTQAELERMAHIFDSFLRLARIESGADGVAFGMVDLALVLEDLVETYQPVAEDNGQHLTYARPDNGAIRVTGDRAMLQQMVVNLLQNAVSHGGIGCQITLSLARDADHVCLSVSDTGPGIPEAAREAVFEPFHRLDPSRSQPGNGLGLALVRAIADRHGAQITLSDTAPGLRVKIRFAAA